MVQKEVHKQVLDLWPKRCFPIALLALRSKRNQSNHKKKNKNIQNCIPDKSINFIFNRQLPTNLNNSQKDLNTNSHGKQFCQQSNYCVSVIHNSSPSLSDDVIMSVGTHESRSASIIPSGSSCATW